MLVLVIYNVFQDGFDSALTYLFSLISVKSTVALFWRRLAAFSEAWPCRHDDFRILPSSQRFDSKGALIIIPIDTLVALLAGMMIFPIVFRFDLDPASGTGLIFQTLPIAFVRYRRATLSPSSSSPISLAAITSMVGFLSRL